MPLRNDKGRMIKLTSDEINTFKTNGSLQEREGNVEEHFGHLYRHVGLDDIKNSVTSAPGDSSVTVLQDYAIVTL